jgi:hypothetical protein
VKRVIRFSGDYLRELGLDDEECLAAALLLAQRVDLRVPQARSEERLSACLIAFLYRFGHVEKAARLLGAVGNWPRMLRLVADELDGKRRKTDLTLTGEHILVAYWVARIIENNFAPATLAEVEAYLAQLLGKTKKPTARTIRQTLKRRKLPLRPDPHRGPRGPWKSRQKTGRKN